ncbi:MAG: purine-binding chemotaxis protein CheW [Labilithrix sp.]|nr:purine-binding chemotaxis protein CheW [Labilithrix sp.]MBX3216684.1 purine-binding chemotaxis protein CheW [Labilithrix sp.]
MARYRHDPSKDLVGFLVGEVMYAVRIEVVREIVNPLAVVDVPRAPPTVKGVADYRGEVVPVIDLRERFGLPAVPRSRKTKWIVLDVGPAGGRRSTGAGAVAGARYAALVVDAVTEVFGLAGGELRPAPPLGAGDDTRGIEGVTTLGSRLVFVLSAPAFGPVTQAALAGGAAGARPAEVT